LRHLKLVLSDQATCKQVLGDITWPKLRILRLHTFRTTPSNLNNLIDRNTSLLRLRLCNGTFEHGTWLQWLPQVAGKWKTVKDVRRRGDFFADEVDESWEQHELSLLESEVGPGRDGRQWDHYMVHGGRTPECTWAGGLADEGSECK